MIDEKIKAAFLKLYPGFSVAFLCGEDADYMGMNQRLGWMAFRTFEAGWKAQISELNEESEKHA